MIKFAVPFDKGTYILEVPARRWNGHARMEVDIRVMNVTTIRIIPDPSAPICAIKPFDFTGEVFVRMGQAFLAGKQGRSFSGYLIGREGSIVDCKRDGDLIQRWVVTFDGDSFEEAPDPAIWPDHATQ